MASPFEAAREFAKLYPYERLNVLIQKAETAYETLEVETIGFCKNIIECMCKTILLDREVMSHEDLKDIKIKPLVKKCLATLEGTNGQINSSLSGVFANYENLVGGMGEIRNDGCVTGHGHPTNIPLASQKEIRVYVSCFRNLSETIMTLLDDETLDLDNTTLPFERVTSKLNLEYWNQQLARALEVDYDPDEGLLYLDGKEIPLAELIFKYDRPAFTQGINGVKEEFKDSLTFEQFEEVIDENINDRMNNFYPGDYGREPLDLYGEVEHVDFDLSQVNVSGHVSTVANLVSSRDGLSCPYSSTFKATFQMLQDYGEPEFQLLKLELNQTDWFEPDEEELREFYGEEQSHG